MNVLPIWLLLFTLTIGSRSHAANVGSMELAALKAQFDKARHERVDEAYSGGLAKLTTSYLQGLKRSTEKARISGDLPTVLALEAEAKQVAQGGELSPMSQAPSPVVGRLRSIYEAELTKLRAAKEATTAELLLPYSDKLKQLEASLTRANRIEDAKEVMEHRVSLLEPAFVAANPAEAGSSGAKGFTNTLGMRFVPLPGANILMCVHETRKRDYAAFAAETSELDGSWKDPKVEDVAVANEDDHPVVNVSWLEAAAFCKWLSKKEGRHYRLPQDREWSVAVGISKKEKVDATPDVLNAALQNIYPWGGTKLPPPKKAGNYGDESARKFFPEMKVVDKYEDSFPTTAPVMSFDANELGIYDLGGNVWEWCEEWFNLKISPGKVLRGGCWFNIEEGGLLSSYRSRRSPNEHSPLRGFRCVVEAGK